MLLGLGLLGLLGLEASSRTGAASTARSCVRGAEPGCSSFAWVVQKRDTQCVLVRAENLILK